MNRKVLLLLCVCLFGVVKVNSNPIVLKGKLVTETTDVKSAPVVAVFDEGSVTIQFNQSLGSLNVKVIDDQGATMYQQDVKATAGSSVFIDAETWDNGEYTLISAYSYID